MKEKILVTGATGLVGSRFVELAKEYSLYTPTSEEMDINNPSSVKSYVEKTNPDWIINFAAFTDVNASEEQTGDNTASAWQINVVGVQNLLGAFKSKNIIQISTDMVFPGDLSQPGPYAETDIPPTTNEKLTWYGWTKNRAEKLINERGGTVLRIIYPVRSSFEDKLDYIRGALKKFVEGKMYPLFHDQQISIAFVDEIVTTLKKIIENDAHGVFHASSDTTTPHELISFVIKQLGGDESLVKSASIHDFLATQKNANRYPVFGGLKSKLTEERLFGGLKTVITEEELSTHFSTWQTVVEYLIGQGLTLPDKQ